MTNIGRMYLQLNEPEKAKTWIDKALKLRLEKLGETNLYYIESLSAAAEVAIQLNEMELASSYLKKVIAVRKQQLPITDWRVSEAENIYAFISFAENPQANKVFQCSLIRLKQQFGDQHYRYKAAVLRQQKLNLKANSELQVSC
jgi:tetratricopeptide (TPR) repeat protein